MDEKSKPKILLGVGIVTLFATVISLKFSAGSYLFFYILSLIAGIFASPFSIRVTVLLVTTSYALRIFLGFVQPYVITFDDEINYFNKSRELIASLEMGKGFVFLPNNWATVYGVLYYLFGSSPFSVKAFNSFLGVLGSWMMYKTALRSFENKRISLATLYISMYLPPNIFLSSTTLKEQIISFGVVLLVYGFTKEGFRGKILMGVGSVILLIFRSSLGVALIPMAFLFTVLKMSQDNLSQKMKRLRLVAVFFLVLGGIVAGRIIYNQASFQTTKAYLILSGKDQRGERRIRGFKGNFAEYMDIENPFSLKNIVLIPIRSVISPSPLRMFKTPGPEITYEAFILTSYMYFAYPFCFLALLFLRLNYNVKFCMAVYLTGHLIASFSILTAAPETFRYRWSVFPVFYMISVAGYLGVKNKWRGIFVKGWIAFIAVFAIVYFR